MTHYEIYCKRHGQWEFITRRCGKHHRYITSGEEARDQLDTVLTHMYVRHWFIAEVSDDQHLQIYIPVDEISCIENMVESIEYIEVEPTPELMAWKLSQ